MRIGELISKLFPVKGNGEPALDREHTREERIAQLRKERAAAQAAIDAHYRREAERRGVDVIQVDGRRAFPGENAFERPKFLSKEWQFYRGLDPLLAEVQRIDRELLRVAGHPNPSLAAGVIVGEK